MTRHPNQTAAMVALMAVLVITPVFASYRDGFFAMIILVLALPMTLMGLVATGLLCCKKRFLQQAFFMQYLGLWLLVALSTAAISSLIAIDGSDQESPAILFVGFGLYYLLVIGPAYLQYMRRE